MNKGDASVSGCLPTGIARLDYILYGGFPAKRLYLIEGTLGRDTSNLFTGPPGSGKSIGIPVNTPRNCSNGGPTKISELSTLSPRIVDSCLPVLVLMAAIALCPAPLGSKNLKASTVSAKYVRSIDDCDAETVGDKVKARNAAQR
jgi:hypothetical protein